MSGSKENLLIQLLFLFYNDDSFYALIKVPNRFAVQVSDTTMLIEKQLLVKTFSSLINPN